ncbi:MAG: hypothetical protein ACYC3Q_11590 [Gemmatimonadaceae bacterium]
MARCPTGQRVAGARASLIRELSERAAAMDLRVVRLDAPTLVELTAFATSVLRSSWRERAPEFAMAGAAGIGYDTLVARIIALAAARYAR